MGYAILKRGQSTTEIAFVFAGIVLLFVAIMQIWFWGNKQIVQRQQAYNTGRVTAGTSSDSYSLQWPVYKPEELKEEAVLKGQ